MTWVPPGPAWLFCPADRPERFAKAAAAADVVILDLEDGVAEADKGAARKALVDTPLDPARTIVRVNAADTAHHADDLAALAATGYRRVMLAKSESAAQVAGLAPYEVVVLVESARGALAVPELATAPGVIALMFGAEDLIASMGGTGSRAPDGTYHDVVRQLRSSVLLAAKANRLLAVDTIVLDIADVDTLRAETAAAVATGFDAKVAIHPKQTPVIRAGYAPSEADQDWARRVLDAAAGARGVFTVDGRMVDAPLLRHAESILRRA